MKEIYESPQSRILLEKGKQLPINNKSNIMEWAIEYGDFRLSESGTPLEVKNTRGEWANVIDLSLQDGSFLTIFTDITKFKSIETELEKTQETQKKVFEAIDELPLTITLWDETFKMII